MTDLEDNNDSYTTLVLRFNMKMPMRYYSENALTQIQQNHTPVLEKLEIAGRNNIYIHIVNLLSTFLWPKNCQSSGKVWQILNCVFMMMMQLFNNRFGHNLLHPCTEKEKFTKFKNQMQLLHVDHIPIMEWLVCLSDSLWPAMQKAPIDFLCCKIGREVGEEE